MFYNLSRCFSCKTINAVEIPNQIEVPEISKYENRRFFVSRKLNTERGTL
jgi:hypothetical protein